jgi:hypothetical protein
MTEFNTGETVVVFYFNKSTGKPHEKQLVIEEVIGQDKYILSGEFSDQNYRFNIETGDFYRIKNEAEDLHLGKDASISPPFKN